ncbi:MAG: Eco57I restriction-modification methylase domain-containing protein [Peptococcaceae bacterium]|nr:Eco57I restriction-modification methylase domain-containing protein [Peptococcaceae bacterium]
MQKYDVVITNPSYMGSSNMSKHLSDFVKKHYPDSKSDLFAVFIERCHEMTAEYGYQAMITQHSWMFLSSYEKLRKELLQTDTVNMAHLGPRAFDEIGGEVVQTTSFVMRNSDLKGYKGVYCRLIDPTTEQGKEEMFLAEENRYTAQQSNFSKISGSPVAYWVSENFIGNFSKGISIDSISLFTGSQNITANNDVFLRKIWEVNKECIGNNKKWVIYIKGGPFRKWYGNIELIINWSEKARYFYKTNPSSNLLSEKYWFKEGITYTELTSGINSFRYLPPISIFDKKGPCILDVKNNLYSLSFFNSIVADYYFKVLNPTITLQVKDVKNTSLIINNILEEKVNEISIENINESKQDWDSFETSWDFKKISLV